MRNKIKQIHNLNARVLKLNPIHAKGYTNFGTQFQHSSIQIVDLFDFEALKSFFTFLTLPGEILKKYLINAASATCITL